jgi:hypothetical protein
LHIQELYIGIWFHLEPEEAPLRDGVVATKWGFTSVTFADWIDGVLNDLRGHDFPLEDVDIEFALATVGLPRNKAFLHQLEHGLRNDLTRARLRVAWHAVGQDRLPGDRTVHSEMYEFARLNPGDSSLLDAYQGYTDHLETGRFGYLAQVQAEEVHKAGVVAALRSIVTAQSALV